MKLLWRNCMEPVKGLFSVVLLCSPALGIDTKSTVIIYIEQLEKPREGPSPPLTIIPYHRMKPPSQALPLSSPSLSGCHLHSETPANWPGSQSLWEAPGRRCLSPGTCLRTKANVWSQESMKSCARPSGARSSQVLWVKEFRQLSLIM